MSKPHLPDPSQLAVSADAQAMIARARAEGIETVWDRLRAQEPQCGYCQLGLSCRNCVMGPCRIDPFGEGPQKGVCGANADVIVARNLGTDHRCRGGGPLRPRARRAGGLRRHGGRQDHRLRDPRRDQAQGASHRARASPSTVATSAR